MRAVGLSVRGVCGVVSIVSQVLWLVSDAEVGGIHAAHRRRCSAHMP
jgi:hypothetical protein